MFTLDFNSDIDGLKSECLENTIAFVVFLFDFFSPISSSLIEGWKSPQIFVHYAF